MTLVVDALEKRFGTVRALDGISFTVAPGEVFGFLGANGAGKTTTMRILLDILKADGGRASWRGVPTEDLPRRTWGYLPEERGLYPRMKVLDQLVFFAVLQGVPMKRARSETLEWLERFRIPDYAGRRAEELSKGNQQKVQFIAAVLHDPEVLLMDEPFAALDPVNVAMLKEACREMSERGKTLVFSTHQMETVEEMCESLVIIDRGRIVIGGSVRDVRRSSGRRVVRLGVVGDAGLPWLDEVGGVSIARHGEDYSELHLEPGVDPQAILRLAVDRGEQVTRFEITDPSLEQVFIERVGAVPVEETGLAARRTAGAVA